MVNVPELNALIEKWITTLSDPNYELSQSAALHLFEQELEATTWWGDNTEAWRTAEEQKWSDRTTWDGNVATHKAHIEDLIARTGYQYTQDQVDNLTDLSLHGFAGGLTDNQIFEKIYEKKFDPSQELPTGTLTDNYDSLVALAEGNLLSLSPAQKQAIRGWSKDIAMGDATLAQAEESIYDIASSVGHYSFLGQDKWDKWQRNGMTLTAFLDPLRQTLATTWEQDASRIDMTSDFFKDNSVITDVNDPTVQRLATNRDMKRAAMADQKYLNTGKYLKDEAETQGGLLKMFGAI
jgi:hypothetical protein